MEKQGSIEICSNIEGFSDALEIWYTKPQVINRRLVGCKNLHSFELELKNKLTFSTTFTGQVLPYLTINNDSSDLTKNPAPQRFPHLTKFEDSYGILQKYFSGFSPVLLKIKLRKIIPKCSHPNACTNEVVISSTDETKCGNLFIPLHYDQHESLCLLAWCDAYGFIFYNSLQRLDYYIHPKKQIEKEVEKKKILEDKNGLESSKISSSLSISISWLNDVLVPKLKKWAEVSTQSNIKLKKEKSLSLIDIEEYSNMYSYLKAKYGPKFVKIWPESTDPQKFVYEDVGIAAYILVIWKKQRREKSLSKYQSFVDLGCGNGLLVHILQSEGHEGRGVDIKKRKIWELYTSSTNLQEEVVDPETFSVTEDWIIGNHSDELTPWIPIMAARCNADFFVLPCCFFSLFAKFQQKKAKGSQYEVYLDYVKSLGLKLGFFMYQDTLRIPSTKKVCFVGTNNTYKSNISKLSDIINSVIDEEKAIDQCGNRDNFTPRDITKEVSKNCTSLSVGLKGSIVKKVIEKLFDVSDMSPSLSKKIKDNKVTSTGFAWDDWNPGGEVSLSELANMFDSDTKKEMKSQCGGLQTLLKNHGHIFKVVKGTVCLRDLRFKENFRSPKVKTGKNNDNSSKWKTKDCWFHTHHPQGCVLSNEECGFIHAGG